MDHSLGSEYEHNFYTIGTPRAETEVSALFAEDASSFYSLRHGHGDLVLQLLNPKPNERLEILLITDMKHEADDRWAMEILARMHHSRTIDFVGVITRQDSSVEQRALYLAILARQFGLIDLPIAIDTADTPSETHNFQFLHAAELRDKLDREAWFHSLTPPTAVHVSSPQDFKDHFDDSWPMYTRSLRASIYLKRNSHYLTRREGAPLWSDFSSGQRQYFVPGTATGRPVKAVPDTGADANIISQTFASDLGLAITPGTARTIRLPNRKPMHSPGKVQFPWKFAGELKEHLIDCWVLPGCVHDLVLGSGFLRATKTLTKFKDRIIRKVVQIPKFLRLRLLGDESQRLLGYLDGHATAALPDTGSDAMFVSGNYARRIGLNVDSDPENWLQVEFADGSTAWTSGVARNVSWRVGGKTIRCDFHVLDDLCVDVVLSKDYLFEMAVFTEHCDSFFDSESEEDIFHLCNIRLIGRYGDVLGSLEDEYVEDVTSPDAFSPEMLQRELARRDLIRDEISALPADQQDAARLAEEERRKRWEELRQAHKERWRNGTPGSGRPEDMSPALGQSAVGLGTSGANQVSDNAVQSKRGKSSLRDVWRKRKISLPIPLRYLKRPSEAAS